MVKNKIIYFYIFFAGLFIFLIAGKASADTYDLRLTDFEFSPAKPVVSQAATIKVKVKNNGLNTLTSPNGLEDYTYTFNNFTFSQVILPSISEKAPVGPGKYFYYQFVGVFNKFGTSTLSFSFNMDNNPAESSLADNYLRKSYQILKLYNLTVDSISFFPTSPAANTDAKITVKIKNAGYSSMATNFGFQSYEYSFPDFTIESKIIPTISSYNILGAGSTTSYIFEGYYTKPGEKSLSFTIDKKNEIDENSESDNSKIVKMKIGTSTDVDLAVDSITFSKDRTKLLLNDEFSITVGIKNKSAFSLISETGFLERDYQFPSGGDYTADFKDITITEAAHDNYPSPSKPLDIDKVFKYTFKVKAAKTGSGAISFTIDNKDKLKETKESNNLATSSYKIYANAAERDEFQISNINIIPVSSSSTIITWQTDQIADGLIMFKEKTYYDPYDRYAIKIGLSSFPKHTDKVTQHKLTLTKLKPNTKYIYQIKSASGYIVKIMDGLEFTAPATDDITITSGPAVTTGASSATVKWQTNLYSSAEVYYKLSNVKTYTSAKASYSDLNHTVNLAKLAAGIYDYYVNSATVFKKAVKSAIGTFAVSSTAVSQSGSGSQTTNSGSGSKVSASASKISIINNTLYGGLKGKIILKVESKGEAYYINPSKKEMYFLGRPEDAFSVMRAQGIGITTANLAKIPVGLIAVSGTDSDSDGLSDIFEDAIGINKIKKDSDDDGFDDKSELQGGFNPAKGGGIRLSYDNSFAGLQKGKILLQVEGKGEAWYINPADGKKYFLGRPADAFSVMRSLGLGITNKDFESLD